MHVLIDGHVTRSCGIPETVYFEIDRRRFAGIDPVITSYSIHYTKLYEMEWHLFAMVFLFGIAYGLKEDGHVSYNFV